MSGFVRKSASRRRTVRTLGSWRRARCCSPASFGRPCPHTQPDRFVSPIVSSLSLWRGGRDSRTVQKGVDAWAPTPHQPMPPRAAGHHGKNVSTIDIDRMANGQVGSHFTLNGVIRPGGRAAHSKHGMPQEDQVRSLMQPNIKSQPSVPAPTQRARNPLLLDDPQGSTTLKPEGKRMFAKPCAQFQLVDVKNEKEDDELNRRHYDTSRRDRYGLHQDRNINQELLPMSENPLRGIQCTYDKKTRVGDLLSISNTGWGQPACYRVQ